MNAADLLLGLASFGLAYLALAIVLVCCRRGPAAPAPSPAPPVTILKPLHGDEPGLYENLASFCAQAYRGPVQVVFGVQSAHDPAIRVVERIRAQFPQLSLDLVVDAGLHGTNRKVSNLINMARVARHDILVLADSDMRVGPDYLSRVVTDLLRPGVGAVTCLYHGVPVPSVWSRLSVLAIDTHYLPSVVVGTALRLAKPCFGSTIALRRETLARIGGFEALADELADDYALGAAVRRLGLDVSIPAFTVGHVCREDSFSELLAHELRWARTIRQIEPAGHLGSALAHPAPFALLAFILQPSLLAAGLLLATFGLRVGLCLATERAFGLRRHPYWLVPARDLLSFGLFLASFLGRRVSWRGHRYGVTRAGILVSRTES